MTVSTASSAALSASLKRLPDFFIVGSPKSGTTSLYEMLRRHPQIYMPSLKEPRFLASDMRPRAGFEGELRELSYPDTLEEYLALFKDATPQQLVGEASTFYLWSQSAAARIAELQPGARIIAVLREPADFLRSLHLMFLQWRVEGERDLRKAISLEADRREGKHIPRRSHRPQLLQYADHVRYVDQLRRYHTAFPPEQMLVLLYDDFRSDSETTVRRLLRFLEVDDRQAIDVMNVNVTTSTVRSWQVKDLVHAISMGRGPLWRAARATVKALTSRHVRQGAIGSIQRRVVVSPPPPDEALALELRRRFKGEVVALSEYLDRDLVSLWGYGDVG